MCCSHKQEITYSLLALPLPRPKVKWEDSLWFGCDRLVCCHRCCQEYMYSWCCTETWLPTSIQHNNNNINSLFKVLIGILPSFSENYSSRLGGGNVSFYTLFILNYEYSPIFSTQNFICDYQTLMRGSGTRRKSAFRRSRRSNPPAVLVNIDEPETPTVDNVVDNLVRASSYLWINA